MAELEVEKTWVVSSAHIAESDSDKLRSGESGMTATCSKFFLLVVVHHDRDIFQSDIDIMEECGFSFEFGQLLVFALTQGFHNIKFDSDGPQVPGFPTFDW